MVGKFFITGLPRSRTAWCANFFTYGEAFCWHDGLGNCASLDQFRARMDAAQICGDSDSGLSLFHRELSRLYPDAQWAVIRRNPNDVIHSLLEMDSYPGIPPIEYEDAVRLVDECGERLDEISKDPRVFTLSFEDLARKDGARALWWHCLRDSVPWNEARYQQLRNMNVTVRSADISLSLHAASQLMRGAA